MNHAMHNNPSRWVLFREARGQGDVKGWENRKFAHSNALTFILAEHYDCTGSEPPEVGYRPSEYKSEDGKGSTHYRDGDWVVTKVDVFVPDIPVGNIYDEIVVCSCEYDPITPEWKAFGKRIVSLDSFGGDREAYNKFIASDEANDYDIQPLPKQELLTV